MNEAELKQLVEDAREVFDDPERAKLAHKAVAEHMRKFCEEQDQLETERKRKALAHWLRIKDIPFMGAAK